MILNKKVMAFSRWKESIAWKESMATTLYQYVQVMENTQGKLVLAEGSFSCNPATVPSQGLSTLRARERPQCPTLKQ